MVNYFIYLYYLVITQYIFYEISLFHIKIKFCDDLSKNIMILINYHFLYYEYIMNLLIK